MAVWIGLIIGLLTLLVNWFKSNAGKPLSDAQKKKVNHALHLMEQVRSESGKVGCFADEDTETGND